MRQPLLSARGLTKAFPGGTELVLDHIDVDIYEGDFTMIMGPSGAGKSTLLYALSSMDGITGGSVRYRDECLERLPEKRLAQLRAQSFGFVFQQGNLVSNLTLLENVAVAGYLDKTRDGKSTAARAEALLRRMHAAHAGGRLPSQVSGGEAQRAAIARAVINRPGLLFADEPTGALNRKNSEEVLDLFTALNREGQSILMVTHDVKAAIRGSRILYLEDGKIRGETALPDYAKDAAREREAQVNAWLASFSW